jgi:hypothetical protein
MKFKHYTDLQEYIIYSKLLDISIEPIIDELLYHIENTVWVSATISSKFTQIYYCDTDFKQIPLRCRNIISDMTEFFKSYLSHRYGENIIIDSIPF